MTRATGSQEFAPRDKVAEVLALVRENRGDLSKATEKIASDPDLYKILADCFLPVYEPIIRRPPAPSSLAFLIMLSLSRVCNRRYEPEQSFDKPERLLRGSRAADDLLKQIWRARTNPSLIAWVMNRSHWFEGHSIAHISDRIGCDKRIVMRYVAQGAEEIDNLWLDHYLSGYAFLDRPSTEHVPLAELSPAGSGEQTSAALLLK